jgi:hypothetical protein
MNVYWDRLMMDSIDVRMLQSIDTNGHFTIVVLVCFAISTRQVMIHMINGPLRKKKKKKVELKSDANSLVGNG